MNNFQKTIKNIVSCSGIGLHTGIESIVTFKPSYKNSGITFFRSDLPGYPSVPADVGWVVDSTRGTTLGKNGTYIHTVEHILAAVYGLGIDNIIIELSSKEPPAMDGSSINFVEVLQNAGIVDQDILKDMIVIQQPLKFSDPDSTNEIEIFPRNDFMVSCSIDYGMTPVGKQEFTINSMKDFSDTVAPARTFCLLSEVTALYDSGLAKGGSLYNTVVFCDKQISESDYQILQGKFGIPEKVFAHSNGILNKEKLRFKDEPVRHKTLDLIGDFALLGRPFAGYIIATRPSHKTNVEMVKMVREIYN